MVGYGRQRLEHRKPLAAKRLQRPLHWILKVLATGCRRTCELPVKFFQHFPKLRDAGDCGIRVDFSEPHDIESRERRRCESMPFTLLVEETDQHWSDFGRVFWPTLCNLGQHLAGVVTDPTGFALVLAYSQQSRDSKFISGLACSPFLAGIKGARSAVAKGTNRVRSDESIFVRQQAIKFGEDRSEEHTSELQSLRHLVCRLLLE